MNRERVDQMFDEIKKILDEEYHITGVSKETNFRKELGLSSFDFLNLICIFEERYGVELDEEKYIHIVTVGELCDYLETLVVKDAT
ncbi:MAG: acyl carrier protein [Lachnospiraceae bacterium]|jgi:acyl carrier protein|nr:acyl carrier protein [Lachnospiraceae bacterium]